MVTDSNSKNIQPEDVIVRDYTPLDHADFCRLNKAWISEHWTIEQRDIEEMQQFAEGVVGGFILLATINEKVVGTIAMIHTDMQGYDYELAKFTTDIAMRGCGIGRKLIAAAVSRCDAENKGRIYIITNKLCHAAIYLYEQFGFTFIPGKSSVFERGDYLMHRLPGI